MLMYKDFGSTR